MEDTLAYLGLSSEEEQETTASNAAELVKSTVNHQSPANDIFLACSGGSVPIPVDWQH